MIKYGYLKVIDNNIIFDNTIIAVKKISGIIQYFSVL